MKKKHLKLIFVSALMTLLCICLSVPSFALDFNGQSGSSGGGGTASSGYSVNTDGTALLGFRFSLVDSSNIQWGSSVDIVSNDRYDTYKNYKKINEKKCKTYWVNSYSSAVLNTSVNNTNFYRQSDMGFATALPKISGSTDIDNLSANLNTWQMEKNNINALLKKIGHSDVEKVEEIGSYKIVIEPLFAVGLKGNDNHVLTMTELAVYAGGYEYNNGWDVGAKGTAGSGGQGSFSYIIAYTNMHFPNYMRTETADCNWGAAPRITDSNTRASFRTIITCGYGANVLSAKSMGVPEKLTVNYNMNDGSGQTAAQDFTYGVAGNRFGYENGALKWGNSGQFGAWDKTGYVLKGWSESPTATSSDSLYSVYSAVDDWWIAAHSAGGSGCGNNGCQGASGYVNLYAVWEPIKLTVNFNMNDGSGWTVAQQFAYGAGVTSDNLPVNQFGYENGALKWGESGQFGAWDKTGYVNYYISNGWLDWKLN